MTVLGIETPCDECAPAVVSDGTEKPFRCKARSPCFTAISALNAMNHGGLLIADAVAVIGSLDIVLGEIDR